MKAEELIEQYTRGIRDFTGVDLSEAQLIGVNLSGIILRQATLNVANLTGANLNQADLRQANLNVARLSGANLSRSNLQGATLNVANLIRVIGPGINLSGASLIKTELIRAELSTSNFQGSNLSDADLRETRLRQANLTHANLSQADLRGGVLVGAYLTRANLHGANLSRANLQGADLREAELRHANLNRTNLQGANLSGANLRWTDLSGADLRWADLSGANLSGANLIGATLTHANLLDTSLVHADLTQADLSQADWTGADLTGVTLTGAKLYGFPRFKLMTKGLICEWVDLSPNGDQSQIREFEDSEAVQRFFNQTPPTVTLEIDTALNQETYFLLAAAYYQLANYYKGFDRPPNLEIGYRRTVLTFRANRDEELLTIASFASLPFQDTAAVIENIMTLLQILQVEIWTDSAIAAQIQQLHQSFTATLDQLQKIDQDMPEAISSESIRILEIPIRITIANSHNQSLLLYQNPRFGKRLDRPAEDSSSETLFPKLAQTTILPHKQTLLDFIQGFAPRPIRETKESERRR